MKKKWFELEVQNCGKKSERVMIRPDSQKPKRKARFETFEAASEAAAIIDTLRIDSAYEGVCVIECEVI